MIESHTPAPWHSSKGNFVYALNEDGTNSFHAWLSAGHKRQPSDEGETIRTSKAEIAANARLIAAAPQLLELLKDLLPEIECNCDPAYLDRGLHRSNSLCHFEGPLKTAIAKATGEEVAP